MPGGDYPQIITNAYGGKLGLRCTHPVLLCNHFRAVAQLADGGFLLQCLDECRDVTAFFQQCAYDVLIPDAGWWVTRFAENRLFIWGFGIGVLYTGREGAKFHQGVAQ